jgi:hypothetical protein
MHMGGVQLKIIWSGLRRWDDHVGVDAVSFQSPEAQLSMKLIHK